MHITSRKFYNFSRWLHIYLSTALFALLLFFCLTGVILNHIAWLSGTEQEQVISAELPEDWPSQLDNLVELTPVASAWLTQEYNLPGPKNIEYDNDFGELILDYSLPGASALAVISIADQQLTLEYQEPHWLSVWSDLHKGRHSGAVWSWVIDVSAVLMLVFAITGLIILWQNRKKRNAGLLAVFVGVMTPVGIYYLFVPFVAG